MWNSFVAILLKEFKHIVRDRGTLVMFFMIPVMQLALFGFLDQTVHNLPTVYRAIERWNPGRINALAVYCSDGRWGLAFDEFCHRHLLIPRYDRWAVPGGPAWLAMTSEDPELRQAILIQLDFLVQVHELERIVLITHHGCAWYSRRLQQTPDECLTAQAEDVATAAGTVGYELMCALASRVPVIEKPSADG